METQWPLGAVVWNEKVRRGRTLKQGSFSLWYYNGRCVMSVLRLSQLGGCRIYTTKHEPSCPLWICSDDTQNGFIGCYGWSTQTGGIGSGETVDAGEQGVWGNLWRTIRDIHAAILVPNLMPSLIVNLVQARIPWGKSLDGHVWKRLS